MYSDIKGFTLSILFFVAFISIEVSAQIPELRLQKQTFQKEILEIMNQADGTDLKPYQLLALARNHYQLDQYREAEKYYLQIITEAYCTHLDYKALAICLRHSGKESLANEFFQTYTDNVPVSTFSILWQLDSEPKKGVTKTNEKRLTDFDFLYGNLNPDGSVNLNIDHGTVMANVGCNSIVNMEAIQFPVQEFNKLGTFTIAEKPGSYYFSYQKENGRFGIYYITSKNDVWSKPKEVILGEMGSDYCFPYFINETLYFSSNKSGGHGQYDLYRASVKGKSVSEVVNLGSHINTDKNDILPSVWNGKFSFSSNGHVGQGGYDLFFSDWSFGRIDALKTPFNSPHNEFLLLQEESESATLLRSGDDKINLVNVNFYYDYMRTFTGRVVDSESNEIEDARVLFTMSYVDQGIFQTSREKGVFHLTIPDTVATWMIECYKQGYESNSFELDLSTLGENPLIIVLNKIAPIESEPVFIVNSPSRNVIPSEPDQINDSTDAPISDIPFNEVDNSGRYYVVYASTKTYTSAYTFWETWKSTVPDIEILKNEEMGVFRVGSYAGATYAEAMKNYKAAQKIKADVWILRPDMQ